MADDPTIVFQDDFDINTDYFRTGRYKPQQAGALVWGDGDMIAAGDGGAQSYSGIGALYAHTSSGKGLLSSAPTAFPAAQLGPPDFVGDVSPGTPRFSSLLLTAIDMQSLVPDDMTAIELNLTAANVRLSKAAVFPDGSTIEDHGSLELDGGWNMAYGFFSGPDIPDTEQRGIYVGFTPEDSGEHFVTGVVDFVADTVDPMMFAEIQQFDTIAEGLTPTDEFEGQISFGLITHSDQDGAFQPPNAPRWPVNTAYNLGDFGQKILLVPRGDAANTVDYQQTFTYGPATFVKTGVMNANFRGKLIGIAVKTAYQESGVITGWGYKVWTTPGVPTISSGLPPAPPPSTVVAGPGESGAVRRYDNMLTGVHG